MMLMAEAKSGIGNEVLDSRHLLDVDLVVEVAWDWLVEVVMTDDEDVLVDMEG